MISSARSSGLVAMLLSCGLACSGSTGSVASTNTAMDQAHLANQANEPRTPDPTAAQAGPVPAPTAGVAVPLGKNGATGKPQTPGNAPAPAAEDATATKTPAAAVETDPPKKIGARHVLVQWMGCDRAGKSVLRQREQAMILIQEVQRRSKAGEDIGRLAVEYSDEPNAGARGGSLGRFGRGQMVGAFETAVFKLKVGEISDIVETPFGFHIIQRTE
jgi:hypothetical protein